jgi:O-antigen/teichoic acid export membrane protein
LDFILTPQETITPARTPLLTWVARIALLGVSPILLFASRFLRNIILSRCLVAEEFGTAVAISVVLSLGELISDVALDRFVMINNSQAALATAHTLTALRALIVGTVSIIAAPALASLFGVPGAWLSFAIACGFSSIRGFSNLSIRLIQREYRYGRATIATVASTTLALIAIFPAISVFHDHRAIVASYFVEFGVSLVLSHVLAPFPYRMGLQRQIAREALAFGLPLTINGAGLAVIYQLDRTLVGYWFGVKELAYYAVILSVSVVPTNLVLGIFTNIGMSYLLGNGQSATTNAARYKFLIGFYAILAAGYTLGLALLLETVTPLIFGPAYSVDRPIHAFLVLIAYLRLQKGGAPTTLLLTSGRTKSLAAANFSAVIGLACAWALIAYSPGLLYLLIGVAFGEIVSFILMFYLAERSLHPVQPKLISHMLTAIFVPTVILIGLLYFPMPTLMDRGAFLVFGLILIGGQFLSLIRSQQRLSLSFLSFRSSA